MSDLPTFESVRQLVVQRPKPPVRARVRERIDGTVTREASVMFDGDSLWMVEDDRRLELNSGEAAVIAEDGEVSAYADMIVCSNNWVKPLFDGGRIVGLQRDEPPPPNPDGVVTWSRVTSSAGDQGFRVVEPIEPSGSVVAREQLLGRDCLIADVDNLKRDQQVTFRMWVDERTGFILRMTRPDMDMVLEVEQLTVGERHEPMFLEDDVDDDW